MKLSICAFMQLSPYLCLFRLRCPISRLNNNNNKITGTTTTSSMNWFNQLLGLYRSQSYPFRDLLDHQLRAFAPFKIFVFPKSLLIILTIVAGHSLLSPLYGIFAVNFMWRSFIVPYSSWYWDVYMSPECSEDACMHCVYTVWEEYTCTFILFLDQWYYSIKLALALDISCFLWLNIVHLVN